MLSAYKPFAILVALALTISACTMPALAGGTATIPPDPAATLPPSDPPASATPLPTLDPTATDLPPSTPLAPTETLTLTPTGTSAVPPVISSSNAPDLKQVGKVNVDHPAELEWTNDDQVIGAMNRDGLVLFDASGLNQVSAALVQNPAILLDFSVNAGLMAVTSDQKTIDLRDLTGGKADQTIDVGSMFMAASFSPDGAKLAVSLADEIAIRIYDTANGQALRTLTGFETAAPVYSGRFSADGTHMIWIARGTVQVVNLDTGVSSPTFSHEDFVNAEALSPDGSILATASAGMIGNDYAPFIQLWDVQSGQPLGRLLTGQDPSNALSFAPNGQILASGTGSQVILWDVAAQKQVDVLGGHTDGVSTIAFSPDGRSLASGASDGTVRIWQVEK